MTTAGIASVLYEFALRPLESKQEKNLRPVYNKFLFITLSGVAVLSFGVIVLGLHSFHASLAVFFLLGLIVCLRRPDLKKPAFVSGCMMMIVALPSYLIPLAFNPQWIQDEWYLSNLSGIFSFATTILIELTFLHKLI